MKLTAIGCSGSYPGPDSPASCYLVEADSDGRTWRILLDLGSGSFGALQRFIDPCDVDAVFFSHLHPDHYSDISGLYVVWKYHPDGARPRIPVWGPAEVALQVALAYGMPKLPGMTNEFIFHEYDDDPIEFGPFTVRATPVKHPVPAYALRIECEGRVLAYSGDTGPCPQLADVVAKGADLFLCEAAFVERGDNPPDLHLTGRQAGAIATEAGVGRLVLTHVPPWYSRDAALEAARGSYPEVELAATGSTYEI
ncbi:MAG: MBL fold metallo-hydrolase [Nocardioidaceae bacterium]